MRRLLLALALSLFAFAAQAQTPVNPGDSGSPKVAQPVPIAPGNWQDTLAGQRCPDGSIQAPNTCGDYRDGYVWGYNGFTNRMNLRPPKILWGPGAITTDTNLTQNAWTDLYSSIGGNGFRGGMTAYVPRGNYMGMGQSTFQTGSVANAQYTIRVLIGSALQTTGSQKGILTVPVIPTNGATAAGSVDGTNNVLSFASTSGISPGMVVYDRTNPAAVSNGVLVCSVTSTTIKLVAQASYPTCNGSGYVASPGVSSGDSIQFGFAIGYGGPFTWTGSATQPFTIPYFFDTHPAACNAADKSLQQCEILVQAYTTDSGAIASASPPPLTSPPYGQRFDIWRTDGNYGGN